MESYGRETLLYPEITGKYVESLIAVFMGYRHKKVFFWRTPQKDEVDIILKNKELLPIEVKYANKIYDNDLKPIMKFCKIHRIDRCCSSQHGFSFWYSEPIRPNLSYSKRISSKNCAAVRKFVGGICPILP